MLYLKNSPYVGMDRICYVEIVQFKDHFMFEVPSDSFGKVFSMSLYLHLVNFDLFKY